MSEISSSATQAPPPQFKGQTSSLQYTACCTYFAVYYGKKAVILPALFAHHLRVVFLNSYTLPSKQRTYCLHQFTFAVMRKQSKNAMSSYTPDALRRAQLIASATPFVGLSQYSSAPGAVTK